MIRIFQFSLIALILFVAALLFVGCPGKIAPSPGFTDNVSMSEIAEAVASGAITSSYSGLTMARHQSIKKDESYASLFKKLFNLIPQADAASSQSQGFCQQFNYLGVPPTTNNTCALTNDSNSHQIITMGWGPCNQLSAPFATWSGGMSFTFMTYATGSFSPATVCTSNLVFNNNDQVIRWFNSPTARTDNLPLPAGTPLPNPVTILVDTYAATQLNAPTAQTLPNTPNPPVAGANPSPYYNGYLRNFRSAGETITYTGAVPRSIVVNGIHVVGQIGGYIVWDFTITTDDPRSGAATGTGATGTALAVNGANVVTGGSLYIQDNRKKITTVSVFGGGIGYTAGCGVPTTPAGTVTTDAVSGTYAHEVLSGFSNVTCGTATLTTTATIPVTLLHSF